MQVLALFLAFLCNLYNLKSMLLVPRKNLSYNLSVSSANFVHTLKIYPFEEDLMHLIAVRRRRIPLDLIVQNYQLVMKLVLADFSVSKRPMLVKFQPDDTEDPVKYYPGYQVGELKIPTLCIHSSLQLNEGRYTPKVFRRLRDLVNTQLRVGGKFKHTLLIVDCAGLEEIGMSPAIALQIYHFFTKFIVQTTIKEIVLTSSRDDVNDEQNGFLDEICAIRANNEHWKNFRKELASQADQEASYESDEEEELILDLS